MSTDNHTDTRASDAAIPSPEVLGLGASPVRPYAVVCMDPAASSLERETALLVEWNKTLAQNARLRDMLARAIRFVDAFEPRSRAAEVDQQETLRLSRDILSNAKAEGQPEKGGSHVE